MNRIPIPAWVLIPMVFVSGCAEGPETLLTNKPNFVVLFADDLGYGDLSSFGNPTLMTPNLDRMAREGVKLTSFYVAAPSCTPSRAALLTGRYPMRSGLYRVLFPEDPAGIPESEVTLGEALQSEGYRTMAIGKWHLGHKEKKFLPTSKWIRPILRPPVQQRHDSSLCPDKDSAGAVPQRGTHRRARGSIDSHRALRNGSRALHSAIKGRSLLHLLGLYHAACAAVRF